MRLELFYLILAITLIITQLPIQAIEYQSVEIAVLKYEPYPAQPGSYLHLYIGVANSGTEKIDNLLVVLEPKFPFYLDEDENATRKIISLEPSDSAVLDYKIRVSANAVEGDNEIKLKYSANNGRTWVEKRLYIRVQTQDANIVIKNFESEEAKPGESTSLKITLKNEADSYLKDINVKLDLSALPFYPISSAEEKRIYQMKSGEEKVLEFKLLVSPEASLGPYKIPVNITYRDNIGQKYEKKNYVTLVVNSSPELIVNLDSMRLLTYMQPQEITLSVVNKGLPKVKFLTVSLEESEDFEILSPSEIYIGNLEPDDYDTVSFKLYVNKKISFLPLKIVLGYRDENNIKYSEEKIINLRLYSKEELVKYNLAKTDYTGYFAIFAAIVIVLVLWKYRRRK